MSQDQDYSQLYDRAWALIGLKRPKEAVPLLTKALELEPDDVYTLCSLSVAFVDLGDFSTALDYANKAIQADPDEEWGHRRRSYCLSKLGRKEQALTAAQEAVRIAPDYAPCLMQLCSAERLSNRLAEAEQTAKRLVEVAPDDADSHIELGLIYISQQKYAEAAESNRTALALDPESSAALNNLGLALKYLGQHQEALHHYHQALQFDPADCIAHRNLILQAEECGYTSVDEYLAARGDPELAGRIAHRNALVEQAGAVINLRPLQAIPYLHHAIALTPYDVSLYLSLSNAHIKRGDLPEALRTVDYSVSIKPDYWEGHQQRSRILWMMSEHPSWSTWRKHFQRDAIQAATAAVYASKEDVNCIEYLCSLLCTARHFEEAKRVALRLIELEPDRWHSHHVMGEILGKQGRWREAEQCFRKGMECEPLCAAAANDVAIALAHQGKKQEALKLYEWAHALEPQNIEYHWKAKGFWSALSTVIGVNKR